MPGLDGSQNNPTTPTAPAPAPARPGQLPGYSPQFLQLMQMLGGAAPMQAAASMQPGGVGAMPPGMPGMPGMTPGPRPVRGAMQPQPQPNQGGGLLQMASAGGPQAQPGGAMGGLLNPQLLQMILARSGGGQVGSGGPMRNAY